MWPPRPGAWRAVLAPLLALTLAGCASSGGEASRSPHDAEGEMASYRKAVGGLGAGYLFQTHLAIGATADLFGRGIYTSEEVKALMETTIGTGRNVAEILVELGKTDLGPGDGRTLEQMREINRLLGEQAEALHAFAGDGTDELAQRFYELRDATWTRLETLLHVEAPPPNPRAS